MHQKAYRIDQQLQQSGNINLKKINNLSINQQQNIPRKISWSYTPILSTLKRREMKYLEINPSEKAKDIYNVNLNFLKKEIGRETRKKKDLPCSLIGRINIVKMIIVSESIWRFNEILIIVLTTFFIEIKEIQQTKDSQRNPTSQQRQKTVLERLLCQISRHIPEK